MLTTQAFHVGSRRRGFTLIELLVVIVIIGILVGLLLPAVQIAREAGRRSHCANNLKQMGLAFSTFHEANEFVPPSALAEHKATWVVHLLPEMEQQALYDEWDLRLCFYDQNEVAKTTVVPQLICTSRLRKTTSIERPPDTLHDEHGSLPVAGSVSDYSIVTSSFQPGSAFFVWHKSDGAGVIAYHTGVEGINEIEDLTDDNKFAVYPLTLDNWKPRVTWATIRDGRSNTLLVGEYSTYGVERAQAFNGDHHHGLIVGPDHPLNEPDYHWAAGSEHNGLVQFVFCDGHVKSISEKTDPVVLGHLTTRAGGEAIAASDF